MISFDMLSPVARAAFALWALLLSLLYVGSALLAVMNKRLRYAVFALLLSAPVYFLWQAIFDFSLYGKSEETAAFSLTLCALPLTVWLAVFAALTVPAILLLVLNIRYDRNHITPGSVKTFLDMVPCGVCCCKDNGRVLFSNVCMNELCRALTGEALFDCNLFGAAVKDGVLPIGEKVWRFTSGEIKMGSESLREIVASDVTEEYKKTRALEKDRANLFRLNRELKEYTLGIEETVRDREIMQAKMNIHDEMNRLMLSSASADANDDAGLDRIFSLWERNALLLCMEADEPDDAKEVAGIEKLAGILKIDLRWEDRAAASLSEERRKLFYACAREAIANAAKHAGAKTVKISSGESGGRLFFDFENDGRLPAEEVRFAGGLANLLLLAQKQGASLSVRTDRGFTLTLCFPTVENQPNG